MTQTDGIPIRTRAEISSEPSLTQPWHGKTTLRHSGNPSSQPPLATHAESTEATETTESGIDLYNNWEDEINTTQQNNALNQTDTNVTSPVYPTVPGETTGQASTVTAEATSEPDRDFLYNLELRVSNEFTPIKESNWDTVLYIGPPTQQHGQSPAEYDYIKQHFSHPYLMRSQTLRDSGSAEFARRLGPMSVRVARKLKNLGLHNNLPNDGTPKYWIDLRPMQNDDEALLTVAELTCTPGVLKWHKHPSALHVDPTVINGKDALNTPKGLSAAITLPPGFFSEGAAALKSGSQNGAAGNKSQTVNDLEDYYSPLRHHTAIERLLYALAGQSPKLNSAPKMWTFFAVAKMFDCARHPRVSSEIFTWIFSGVNSNFIQANPEVCYRIAMGTQSEHSEQSKVLLRVVFSILVGEKALDQAMDHSITQSPLSPTTSRIRPLSHLDDDEVNRIDHAARSLSLRAHKEFQVLYESPLTWMSTSTELFKLLGLVGVHAEHSDLVDVALGTLLQHVRNELLHALTQNLSNTRVKQADLENSNLNPSVISGNAAQFHNTLSLPQRLLCQQTWAFIRDYALLRDTTRFAVQGTSQYKGMKDVLGYQPKDLPISVGVQFEQQISAINNHIADGYVHYNGIHSHQNHLGDYEVRWDSLYLAALRNFDGTSKHMTNPEQSLLEGVARRREQMHRQDINAYESAQNVRQSQPGWPTPTAREIVSTDHYYTSSKIDVQALLQELSDGLKNVIDADILRKGYLKFSSGMEADISVGSVDTLLCLDEDEYRYLPLWADGCDDGTGGVFTENVPGAIDEDFQGGKRGLGADEEGLSHLDDIEMGEGFSVIDSQEAVSTVAGASKVATAGYGTDSVMSMDE